MAAICRWDRKNSCGYASYAISSPPFLQISLTKHMLKDKIASELLDDSSEHPTKHDALLSMGLCVTTRVTHP